ncbi:hypothetical protein D3C71_2177370 [compost metagenome]
MVISFAPNEIARNIESASPIIDSSSTALNTEPFTRVRLLLNTLCKKPGFMK